MFILGYLLRALAKIADIALMLFMFTVVARAILSWVNPDPFNPIVRFIHNVTEPVLFRIRSTLPVVFGGIDLSPILVLFGIIFLQNFLVPTLYRLAESLI